MTTDAAKDKILSTLMGCEISLYTTLYGPDTAVVSISNLLSLIPDLTRCRARLAIKDLLQDGIIKYTSQGHPAIESFGEYRELVCDAMPPTNGYALTQKAYETDIWKNRYAEWEKSMEEWTNGGLENGEAD